MHAEVLSLQADPTATAAFRRWFGDSKAVSAAGEPLVVYHGTASTFEAFYNCRGNAYYFTDDLAAAQAYAAIVEVENDQEEEDRRVIAAYLQLANPMMIDMEWAREHLTDRSGEIDWTALDEVAYQAQDAGHDGMILRGIPDFSGLEDGQRRERVYDQYLVFSPSQIKSVANRGTWDAADPRIAFKRGGTPLSLAWLDRPQLASAEQVEEAASVQYENQAAADAGYAPADELRWLIVENYPVARLAGLPDRQWWEQEQAASGGRWSELESQDVILPVVIMDDGQAGHVWDGYHRATATVLRGKATLPAIVGVRPELLAEAFPEMEENRCSPKF